MSIVAGIDEAGYGPPLGPLVVSGVVFYVPDEHGETDLWKLLTRSVSPNPRVKRKLVVADSKQSYSRSKGIGVIEETSLCFLAVSGGRYGRVRELLRGLAGKEADDALNYPWYRDQDAAIPLSGRALGLDAKVERLSRTLDDCGVKFLAARCVPLFEAAFNRSVEETGNKQTVLFGQTAKLISGIMKRYSDDHLCITVDKHGGRDRYAPLLGRRFKGARLVVKRQDRHVGHYELRHRGRHSDVRFVMNGEKHSMPVALASMFSKYVREVYMKMFNGFWKRHLPTVKSTAGYAQDARRFLSDIAPVRQDLGIPDDVLVRRR